MTGCTTQIKSKSMSCLILMLDLTTWPASTRNTHNCSILPSWLWCMVLACPHYSQSQLFPTSFSGRLRDIKLPTASSCHPRWTTRWPWTPWDCSVTHQSSSFSTATGCFRIGKYLRTWSTKLNTRPYRCLAPIGGVLWRISIRLLPYLLSLWPSLSSLSWILSSQLRWKTGVTRLCHRSL